METGWERRHPPFEVPAPRLEALVRRFAGTRAFRVRGALPHGLANLNVRVALGAPAEDVVVRIYVRDSACADKEAALLRRLEGVVPVPHVLTRGTDPGEDDESPLTWLVTAWVPGVALTDMLATGSQDAQRTAGADIGRALATLHARRYEQMGFLDARLEVVEPLPGVRATVESFMAARVPDGRAGRRLGAETSARLLRFVAAQAPCLDALEGHYALLHADCKPTNVRVTPEGTLTGLMDWEFAWVGPPLFDLGQMLRWPVPAPFEDALVGAYAEAGGGLPEDWRLAAHLLDLLNLVGFLDDDVERPVTTRDVKALIEATLDAY